MIIYLIVGLAVITGIAIPFFFKNAVDIVKFCFIAGIIAIIFSMVSIYLLPFGLSSNGGNDLVDVFLLEVPSFKARLVGAGYFLLLTAVISFLVLFLKRVLESSKRSLDER